MTQAANKVDISVGGTKSEIISQASDPLLLGRQQTPLITGMQSFLFNNSSQTYRFRLPTQAWGQFSHMGNSITVTHGMPAKFLRPYIKRSMA